jgi:hypothetical protein
VDRKPADKKAAEAGLGSFNSIYARDRTDPEACLEPLASAHRTGTIDDPDHGANKADFASDARGLKRYH